MQVQVEALGMSRALALLGGHRHRGSSSRRVKNVNGRGGMQHAFGAIRLVVPNHSKYAQYSSRHSSWRWC